jgi:cytochrome c nitrite reductase small subunit
VGVNKFTKLLGRAPLWAWLALAALVGGIVGVGGFTFTYGQGYSYLGNDPSTCANCHIMRGVYDGWNHSSHKDVATCNDCHTPHNVVAKYIVKGTNGFNHSSAFTLGNFHEPVRIKASSRQVALENCIYCHGDLVEAMAYDGGDHPTDCLRCHASVGHDS